MRFLLFPIAQPDRFSQKIIPAIGFDFRNKKNRRVDPVNARAMARASSIEIKTTFVGVTVPRIPRRSSPLTQNDPHCA
jgi:hypothetical protein